MPNSIRYLVFDTESVADAALVAKLRYAGQGLSPGEAVRRYRDELMEKYESDFIPYSFQMPISVAVGKVTADFRLEDVVMLDEPQFRPHVITENFWRGWEKYRQPRSRYNTTAHIDLCELLTNFGSTRFTGGLNLAANLLGKPGKMDVQGDMVQDMYDAGRLAEINDYCRCDVLDTYFVFLRTRVLLGQLALEAEQQLIAQTKQWLESKAESSPAFRLYLDHWGDWLNPWTAAEA